MNTLRPTKGKFNVATVCVAISIVLVGVSPQVTYGLPYRAQVVVAIFISTLFFWLTKPVPYTVSSIYAVCLLYLFLYESFQQAAIGFSSLLIYFLVLLLLLGQTIEKVELGQHVTARLLTTSGTAKKMFRSMWVYIFVLGLIMPSAIARLITFLPIVKRMRQSFGFNHDSPFTRSSYIILGYLNPIVSVAFMTGGGLAIATSELLKLYTGPITWIGWAIYMVPPVTLLYFLTALFIEFSLNLSMKGESPGLDAQSLKPSAREETEAPLTRDQKIVITVMGGTIIGWSVGSVLGVPTVLPALIAVMVLSLPGINLVTAEDVRKLNWEILFLMGAMFSLLNALQNEQVISIAVKSLGRILRFGGWEVWQIVVGLCAVAVVIRFLFSTASAATIVTLPIVVEFGNAYGINPLHLGLSIMMLMMSTAFLPFHTATVLVAYESGPLRKRDVFYYGAITFVCTCIVIFVSWVFYWPQIQSSSPLTPIP